MKTQGLWKASFLLFIALLLSCEKSEENIHKVGSYEAFNAAVAKVKPGEKIVLEDGTWTDVELLFEAKGTEAQPIELSAENPGNFFLEGQSNLRIAGEHLIVRGLVFRNGHTPTSEVISFRKDEKHLAHHSRLTECVIDNFSHSERQEQDYWIGIYGKHNRIDHNHIEGKKNLGVTMAVRLNAEESRENHHRIDHNYFGPRNNLGANGGETLRIGTSHFSLTNSNTLVESNYFDRCSGEHEIISNKSGQNTYRYNTFYECSGTLTMRHGNETHIEGNVFLGNNKPSTGGIRVINEKQTVVDNYGYGLKGYRFRGALVVMNGVPNSPLNRYFQVDSARVEKNVFVDCDHVQLCAGSDAERSATPINSSMRQNVFYHSTAKNIFTVYDDVSGIDFDENLLSAGMESPFKNGFVEEAMSLKEDQHGFPIPHDKEGRALIKIHEEIATLENTGVTWYEKRKAVPQLGGGKEIVVEPGVNTLFEAAKKSAAGDVLMLKAGASYMLTKSIGVEHPLTIKAEVGEKPLLLFERSSLFDLGNGGSLALHNLRISGKKSPDYSGNAVIRTSRYSMNENYKIFVVNCDFEDLDVNHSFDVIKIAKSTFADTIQVEGSTFKNISGNVMALNKELEDKGVYNAEYVIVKNSVFSNIGGVVLDLYRGGKDESTFGPFLEMENCSFEEVGLSARNKSQSALVLYGVQDIGIHNNSFTKSAPSKIHLVVGEPIVHISQNEFIETALPTITGDQAYTMESNIVK